MTEGMERKEVMRENASRKDEKVKGTKTANT